MLKQLELGIPSDALDLLTMPLRFARGEYLALYGTGIKTAKEFWELPEDKISEILGQERATQAKALRSSES